MLRKKRTELIWLGTDRLCATAQECLSQRELQKHGGERDLKKKTNSERQRVEV